MTVLWPFRSLSLHLRVVVVDQVEVDPVFAHHNKRVPKPQLVQAPTHTGQHQCPGADCLQVTTRHLGGRWRSLILWGVGKITKLCPDQKKNKNKKTVMIWDLSLWVWSIPVIPPWRHMGWQWLSGNHVPLYAPSHQVHWVCPHPEGRVLCRCVHLQWI